MNWRIVGLLCSLAGLNTPAFAVSEEDYQSIINRDSQAIQNQKDYSITAPAIPKTYDFQFRGESDPNLESRYLENTPSNTNVRSNAQSTAQKYRNQYGTAQGIRENAHSPLQGGGSLSTLDGSHQFNAQLSCPTETPFLDIAAIPTGTGDLSSVIVVQNTDLEGPPEHTASFENVSGICSNGYISCNPGTWDNCIAYEWEVGPAPEFRFTHGASDITRLIGCTCINNSCGSMLVFNNMPTVMDIIGGGIANTIIRANPEAQISRVVHNDVQIQFFGQQVSNCNILQTNTSASNASYLNDTASMASAATNEVASNEMYDLIQQSPMGQQQSVAHASCSIVRDWTIEQRVKNEISDHLWLGGNSCVRGQIGELEPPGTLWDSYYSVVSDGTGCYSGHSVQLTNTAYGQMNLRMSMPYRGYGYNAFISTTQFTIDDMDFIDSAVLADLFIDDHINIYVNGVRVYSLSHGVENSRRAGWVHGYWDDGDIYSGYAPLSDYWHNAYDIGSGQVPYSEWLAARIYENPSRGAKVANMDIKPLLVEGSNTIKIEVFIADGGQYSANFVFREAETCEVREWETDVCEQLRDRSECTLSREAVDGIVTYNDYLPTGLSPLPSTQTKSTPLCTYSITKDWWQTDQDYVCVGDPATAYNFDTALNRMQHVKDSAENQNHGGYEDLVPGAGGAMTTVQSGLTNHMQDDVHTIEELCITQLITDDDQVAANGVASEQRDPDTGQRIIKSYRSCYENTCPVEPGETIIQECAVVDSLPRVMTEIQLLRQGGKDLTCSTNTLNQPATAEMPPQP